MKNNELIRKVCELTCVKKEVLINQTTVKYDTDNPFTKYYSLSTIKGAIEKYLSKEWDDQTLSHWACLYCWILSGGFKDKAKENLNSFEQFIKNCITWELDGLSFFDSEGEEQGEMQEWVELFENYDHIWQTRKDWKAVYTEGPYAKENGDQYVLLINEKTKEYMIAGSDYLDNGYEDGYFKFVSPKEHLAVVKRLKNEGYSILKCVEDYYYEEMGNK